MGTRSCYAALSAASHTLVPVTCTHVFTGEGVTSRPVRSLSVHQSGMAVNDIANMIHEVR